MDDEDDGAPGGALDRVRVLLRGAAAHVSSCVAAGSPPSSQVEDDLRSALDLITRLQYAANVGGGRRASERPATSSLRPALRKRSDSRYAESSTDGRSSVSSVAYADNDDGGGGGSGARARSRSRTPTLGNAALSVAFADDVSSSSSSLSRHKLQPHHSPATDLTPQPSPSAGFSAIPSGFFKARRKHGESAVLVAATVETILRQAAEDRAMANNNSRTKDDSSGSSGGARLRRKSRLMGTHARKSTRMTVNPTDALLTTFGVSGGSSASSSATPSSAASTTGRLANALAQMDPGKGALQLVEFGQANYRKNKPLQKLMLTRGTSKTYIRRALLASLAHEPRAPGIYRDITAFMGERNSQKSSGELIMHLLDSVHAYGEDYDNFRDEAFCQILKQISGNGNAQGVLRGWELLMVVASFTPCSGELAPALLSWIDHAEKYLWTRNDGAGGRRIADSAVRRVSARLPKMLQHQQGIVLAMDARDESLVPDDLRTRTRARLEMSLDRGTRIHTPRLSEIRAALRNLRPQLRLLLPSGEPMIVEISHPHQECVSFIKAICARLGLSEHCAITFGVVEAECSAPALLYKPPAAVQDARPRTAPGGGGSGGSGSGQAGGVTVDNDDRAVTLELPLWVDADEDHSKLYAGDSDSDNEDSSRSSGDGSGTTVRGSGTITSANPAFGNKQLHVTQSFYNTQKAAHKHKSTMGATATRKDLLQWHSGRETWTSVLELADVSSSIGAGDVGGRAPDGRGVRARRPSSPDLDTAPARRQRAVTRDALAEGNGSSAFNSKTLNRSLYRQVLLRVHSEDEVEPQEKIADVGCRIIEAEEAARKAHKKNRANQVKGLFRAKGSFKWNARERALAGGRFERMLFKPVCARIVDRSNRVEVSLHYEQARSDFVSGHFETDTPEDLLVQLVALLVHSTAGNFDSLSELASLMGQPFIRMWRLMPLCEYVPAYAHETAWERTFQSEVLAVMKQYKNLTPLQSRLAFVDTCQREFPFYGAHFYVCTVSKDTNILTTIGANRILAVSPRGVALLRTKLRQDAHQEDVGKDHELACAGMERIGRVLDLSATYTDLVSWRLVEGKNGREAMLGLDLPNRRVRLQGRGMRRALRGIEANVALMLLQTKQQKQRQRTKQTKKRTSRKPAAAAAAARATTGSTALSSSSLAAATPATKKMTKTKTKKTASLAKAAPRPTAETKEEKKNRRRQLLGLTTKIQESKSNRALKAPPAVPPGAPAVPPTVPAGWVAHLDDGTQKYYFHHRASNTTTWNLDDTASTPKVAPGSQRSSGNNNRGRGGKRRSRGGGRGGRRGGKRPSSSRTKDLDDATLRARLNTNETLARADDGRAYAFNPQSRKTRWLSVSQ